MVGQHAPSGPFLTDATEAARAAEPICQVYDLDGLFGGVNRPRVGDALVSPGASLSISVYNHVNNRSFLVEVGLFGRGVLVARPISLRLVFVLIIF